MTDIYHTKIKKVAGADYREIGRIARTIYKNIASRTKRKPYIRSEYFGGEKIFLDYFWHHLSQKNQHDRLRRLKYYGCAIDLIKHSHSRPSSQTNKEKPSEMLYRFCGITREKDVFCVQIKEEKVSHNKHFISVFPIT